PRVLLAALWVLYLSLVSAGQDFLSFQWDNLLLELGFAAILFAPGGIRPSYRTEPSKIWRWVLWFLVFRLMFESGLVKLLSRDPNWRNLSALSFHYETQPLPTPLAWYAHHLSAGFQRASAFGVFVIELAVPFLFFMPRRLRIIGAWTTIAFQTLIAITGNYGFFNLLTILLCISLLDDRHLRLFGVPQTAAPRGTTHVASFALAVFLIAIGFVQLFAMLAGGNAVPGPIVWLDEKLEAFRIVNRYGLFAVMTTSRPEIVIEGSDDMKNWKAYEFKFKA